MNRLIYNRFRTMHLIIISKYVVRTSKYFSSTTVYNRPIYELSFMSVDQFEYVIKRINKLLGSE